MDVVVSERTFERDLLAQPALAGGSLEFVKRLSARHSELFEYRLRLNSHTSLIVVKKQAAGSRAGRETREEFANLEKVRTVLGMARAESVPKPILALPQEGLLVVEKVPGTPFAAILKKDANYLTGPFFVRAISEATQLIGRWLREFQKATHSEPLIFQADPFLTDLEHRLSRYGERGFGTDLPKAILHQAAIQSARLNGRVIPAAGRHGDFVPQNIMVRNERVSVVDFEGFTERQPIYDDIGMFLAYLSALAGRLRYWGHSLGAARKGFLTGLLAGDALDGDLANIYVLKGAVRILADAPRKTPWDRWAASRMLVRLCRMNSFKQKEGLRS